MKTVTGSECALEELFEFFAERLEQVFPLQVEADLFLLNVVEAVNNALEHGHTGNEQQHLKVSYCFNPNQAFVIVKDCGGGFNIDLPEPEDVTGPRGRGLVMIKTNSDVMLQNRPGNEIAFFKGGFLIDCLLDQREALTLNNGVIIITEIQPRCAGCNSSVFQVIFQSLKRICPRMVFLDLKYFKDLSSGDWESISAEIRDDAVTLLVLFNVSEAIAQAWGRPGTGTAAAHAHKINIFTELEPTVRLMERLLRKDLKNGEPGVIGP